MITLGRYLDFFLCYKLIIILKIKTAEAFARSTGTEISEELASMRNRQAIQRLVLDGRIGEAISLTQQLYPGLLRDNVELLFRLKVS